MAAPAYLAADRGAAKKNAVTSLKVPRIINVLSRCAAALVSSILPHSPRQSTPCPGIVQRRCTWGMPSPRTQHPQKYRHGNHKRRSLHCKRRRRSIERKVPCGPLPRPTSCSKQPPRTKLHRCRNSERHRKRNTGHSRGSPESSIARIVRAPKVRGAPRGGEEHGDNINSVVTIGYVSGPKHILCVPNVCL